MPSSDARTAFVEPLRLNDNEKKKDMVHVISVSFELKGP